MNDDSYPLSGDFLKGRLRQAMSEHEKRVVENLSQNTRVVDGDAMLIERGSLVNHSTLLIEGYMLRTVHAEGKRHIVGIQVPGDFVDLHAFALKRLDHDLMVIGSAKIAEVPHDQLEEIMRDEPHLARLFWFSTLLDAAIHREWIMKTGQLRAIGRMAHLFCEIWYRLRMVGRGRPDGFQTPLTQLHLAEICGMSTIHVNRTLRDLREMKVLEFRRGLIVIHDADKLKSLGKFDPAYLYGEGGLEVGNELDVRAS